MSFDIYLNDPETGTPIQFDTPREDHGGTYCVGGTTEAWLNITYNYSEFYYEYIDSEKGIRWLYGKKASDCIERLEYAVQKLGTKQYRDYWAPTKGNAGHALSILLKWAKEYPDGIFSGD